MAVLSFLHTKIGNITYSLSKKLLQSSSDGHITWRAELCQQWPQEGLLNSTGLNKGLMVALKGNPQRMMQIRKKKKGHRARIDDSNKYFRKMAVI